MIIGAHSIINSKKPEQDRRFLSEVLGLPHVDAGHGWLIFGLPPSEIAVHPADESGTQEMFFIVKDIHEFVSEMKRRKIKCSPPQELRWGILTQVTLPGGGKLGFYQALHPRPKAVKVSRKKPLKAKNPISKK
jgi:hypothetical protein